MQNVRMKGEENANGGLIAKASAKGKGNADATCPSPRRRASPAPWPQAAGTKPRSAPLTNGKETGLGLCACIFGTADICVSSCLRHLWV